MSGGPACSCKGKKEDRLKNWIVITYRCNYSAFSGYRRTPSDYSLLECTKCKRVWRTKSSYVATVFYNQGSAEKNFSS